MTEKEWLLEVDGVCKSFRGRRVVDSVTFTVSRGEIVGLLGPNGAGKTTTFRMVMGILKPDMGKILFEGKDVSGLPMYRRVRLGIGYLAQEPSIFRKLTVKENILIVLEAMGMRRRERREKLAALLDEFGLSHLEKSRAGSLSGGERRKLEIARALALSPRLLLLDEPFSGVDPIAVSALREIIRGLCNRGIGILLTDHNVRDTLRTTDRAYIMKDGTILVHGTASELTRNELAREHYLGDYFD